MRARHANIYRGTDDNMPDSFDAWVSDMQFDEIVIWANLHAKQEYLNGKEEMLNILK